MSRHIPVSRPIIGETESRYVNDALASEAISGLYGEYIPRFEHDFASYCDCKYGVATSGGTPALHLALASLNIASGDEVLVSTLTNMATFFAVIYQGATPIPIDVESGTWNMNPSLLEACITPRTRAIMVVHLFGHPVDMDGVLSVAEKHGLHVIEDCAEAHGATYKGRKVGSLGDIGCFSFYANKVITTGEGGMLTTNNRQLAERAQGLKSLAFGSENKFMHKDVGFNYRMTNLQAAIGCAQFERIEEVIAAKRNIAAFYQSRLKDIPDILLPTEKDYARNVYWMYHIMLTGSLAQHRPAIMKSLGEKGIETREGFIPANMQEIFIKRGFTVPGDCPVAAATAYSGFYLPSGPVLSEDELDYVATQVCQILKEV